MPDKHIGLSKLKIKMRDAKYVVVDVGGTNYELNDLYYILTNEVEHRLTRKNGWISTVCSGGGWCKTKHCATTKVFENEHDAATEGKALLKTVVKHNAR